MGPVLVFPNASTQNIAFLSSGFPWGLRALSVCSWVCMASGHLGTLLSYATEENDTRLVLCNRDSPAPGSIHLVIGDPAFRELPLQPLLDGVCHLDVHPGQVLAARGPQARGHRLSLQGGLRDPCGKVPRPGPGAGQHAGWV